MKHDILYEYIERPLTQFVSIAAINKRYDFAFVHTRYFYGKCLIVSMQNLAASFLSREDIQHEEQWAGKLAIDADDTAVVKEFLFAQMGTVDSLIPQY